MAEVGNSERVECLLRRTSGRVNDGGFGWKAQVGEDFLDRGSFHNGSDNFYLSPAEAAMGNVDVVGYVSKGDRFYLVKIDGEWASLKKLDGTAVRGWIRRNHLKPA